jgi:hypothetical protein
MRFFAAVTIARGKKIRAVLAARSVRKIIFPGAFADAKYFHTRWFEMCYLS